MASRSVHPRVRRRPSHLGAADAAILAEPPLHHLRRPGLSPVGGPRDPAAYSQQHAVDDAIAVLDAHSVGEAHVVGISMGGFAGLHLAMQHPGRVRSLVAAGTGYGARPGEVERFRGEATPSPR